MDTVDGAAVHADADIPTGQDLALHGLFTQPRFLALVRSFINFVPAKRMKRIAKPHQYFAVTRAADAVRRAAATDGKAGVVWHTQGSGKSEEMVLTTNLVMRDPALHNPTVVVVTDRTDLDDQLFDTFKESEVLPEQPHQFLNRAALREELAAKRTGGILFTTLQKFGRTKQEKESGTDHPLLSERRNIVVVVDEAHRSHYDHLDGYARHLRDALPHATLLAFTGTPISEADRNTREVFGDYIDTYDLKRAADDGATVKVYHESRVVQLVLDRDVDPTAIDTEADRITDGLDDTERTRVEQAVATMNAMYGAPARIRDLTQDLVEHWEARRAAMLPFVADADDAPGGAPGKAMLVCATREICVRVYDALRELRPDWHTDDPTTGAMKIVYSSDSRKDSKELRAHALRDSQRKAVINRAKDPEDELQLLIVNNMLLTGFDAPSIHTMYLDRPLRGAGLMQALARVNRRFRKKEEGLLVGYAPSPRTSRRPSPSTPPTTRPTGPSARTSTAPWTSSATSTTSSIRCSSAGTGANASPAPTPRLSSRPHTPRPSTSAAPPPRATTPTSSTTRTRPSAAASANTATAWSASSPSCGSSADISSRFTDQPYWKRDIQFLVEVRTYMAKLDAMDREAQGLPVARDVALYLSQLTSAVVETGGVTDLFSEAGLDKADLTHLNDALVGRLQNSETPHLAAEALRRLVEQKMREQTRHNIVRQTAFSERLQDLMTRYMRQQLTSAEIIAQLVELAKTVAEDARRGEKFTPPLGNDELAFYDAVADLGSARDLMGDEILSGIARDLVVQVRKNLKKDWIAREPVRARLRATIRRLLARHGYPPEQSKEAIDLVIRQMEHFADKWSQDGSTADV